MDKFDRNVQRELLKELYDTTPNPISAGRESYYNDAFGDKNALIANLRYLRDHGLITCSITQVLSGAYTLNFRSIEITNKGIDFIRDDGGLSAILNIQTIKFHRDAVVILEDLIAISNMSDDEKEKAKTTFSELSTEALKALVQTIITAGLTALSK